MLEDVRVVDSGFISDHQLILATLHTSSMDSSLGGVPVTYRRIKDIDPVEFESRLRRSSLFSSPALTAESYASQFEEVVVETLDAMAPLRTRVRRPPKKITRWLSDEAVEAKRERRRLEKRWSSSKSDSDRIAYRRACRRANKLFNESRKDYFRSQLASSEDCRERWQITKRLLHSARTAQNRAVDELQQLCDKFAKFFINKIISLKHSVALTLSTISIFHAPDSIYVGEPLDSVTDVTADEVLKLILSMPSKSSSVDFIPTSLIKLCPLAFFEIIATLANLSFSQGIFPTKFKKPSLDPDNPANYRPISNLNNISKMLERLFLSRFYPHVPSSPHFNHFQSAYRKFHSTESALLHTFDSIYRSADQSKPTFLVSLDLSAAFDTIDHSILMNRLSTSFGIQGSALAWLTSYLSDRSQTIRIGSAASGPSNCQSGVPQGSVLGPILFSLYISPLGHIISSFNISRQQYADDSQLYISLVPDSIRASLDRFETCLSAVRSWLCTNGLCLNPDKPDSIILGTHQRFRTFPAIPAVKIANTDINISNEITSLGVIMDSKLTLDSHISAICESCYHHLRSLRHIRRSLTQDMAISVAVAIVQSRLDYCNSLLYDISNSTSINFSVCRTSLQDSPPMTGILPHTS